ncbi:MAG TPA: phosphoribosylglycinamide formyltransferase [Candidatus Ruthenibacterium merdavium]|uniref:Phosphoribosylglycinamide formyltransferase n=1 Tax=Candidatus Ruthenibacterium merdavium TaxID=2838752 RepID=A0A9D2Q218_9FIRM|nr:phosphoribosylglycinamide formyltransferase [Candidatus Ruthenibacterium merdavium]
MVNVAVLVSGGGTNLQALIDAKAAGSLPNAKLALVIASKPGVYALECAKAANISSEVVCRKDFDSQEAFDSAMLETLRRYDIGAVVLAGYLSIVGAPVVAAYPDKIINIHPSLIPSFCGAGYYGLRVHEAALKKGVKVTGATVHLVNEQYDDGRILLQKAVSVEEGDTPETLQKRVMKEAEWVILPKALDMITRGE